ncbi:MAG: hypothetical protein ACI9C4_003270 [Paraglaciecola sp.]
MTRHWIFIHQTRYLEGRDMASNKNSGTNRLAFVIFGPVSSVF